MIEIGKYSDLEIVKEVDFGLYLNGGPFGEILLPKQYVDDTMKVGEEVRVFIYTDSEDRIIATTMIPHAAVGDFAYLQAKDLSNYGAFLDWGIHKDLFVPFQEQIHSMTIGDYYLVRVYLDEASDRVAATTKLNRFLENTDEDGDFEEGQEVDIIIAKETPNGYKAIVNETHWGMIYRNEVFKKMEIGSKDKAFIKQVRPDGLIDLAMQKQGYRAQIPEAVQVVLEKLEANDGFLPLTDKSPPEVIYDNFSMSKKNFKKAVGYLYKNKQITLSDKGITLVK